MTIGLILADIANPFSSHIARIIEDEAQKSDYSVIYSSSDEKAAKTEKLIKLLLNRQVDGLIIAFPENTQTQVQYLKQIGIPFVMIDRYFPEIEANCVVIENYRAAISAIRHLQENGRRRVGIISYATSLYHLNERRRGALDLLGDNAMVGEVRIDHVAEDVAEAINRFLSEPYAVDAIFFTTNLLTISGLKCLNDLSVKVPDQIAVVGFDETDAFDLFYAPVTYVKQPMAEMGRQAVNLLLETIATGESLQNITLDSELIVRKSSVISQ